jgi:protocatechuate 3,4-dioxygenase beta subunit
VRKAPVPAMPRIDRPVAGWIAGTAVGPDGKGIDGARIEMRRAGWWPFRHTLHTVTDGNGWFGFADVAPGRYQVRLPGTEPALAEVEAGRVKRVELRISH